MYRRRRPVHCATMASLSGQISAGSYGTVSAKTRLSDRSRQPEHAYLNRIGFGRAVQMAVCGQCLPPKARNATCVVFRNSLECGEITFPGWMVSGQDAVVGLESICRFFHQCPMWGDFTPSLHRSVRRHRQCAGNDYCTLSRPTAYRAMSIPKELEGSNPQEARSKSSQ